MATKKTGKPRGRPTAYFPEYAEQAEKLCRLGATNEELAQFFNIGTTTLKRWISLHPEFRTAIKSGKEMADAEVADKLFKRATGYSHPAVKIFNDGGQPLEVSYTEHYPPDTTAAIFWLKNRRPDLWRDKIQQELSGPGGQPLAAPVFTVTFMDGNDGSEGKES